MRSSTGRPCASSNAASTEAGSRADGRRRRRAVDHQRVDASHRALESRPLSTAVPGARSAYWAKEGASVSALCCDCGAVIGASSRRCHPCAARERARTRRATSPPAPLPPLVPCPVCGTVTRRKFCNVRCMVDSLRKQTAATRAKSATPRASKANPRRRCACGWIIGAKSKTCRECHHRDREVGALKDRKGCSVCGRERWRMPWQSKAFFDSQATCGAAECRAMLRGTAVDVFGIALTRRELAELTGVSSQTIKQRMMSGNSPLTGRK